DDGHHKQPQRERSKPVWLKDHQDAAKKLVQQQAEAFQLHLDTLRVELQATRGDDLDRWIFAVMKYFSLLSTPAGQRLRIVGFNLEGMAAEWFQWMSHNGLITTWDSELASPKIKGSLNDDEDIGVDEVSRAIDGVFDIDDSNIKGMEVRSKFGEFSENKKSVEEVVGDGEALRVGEDDVLVNEALDRVDDMVESEDISILSSLIGHGSPCSLQS
nr:retrotransposon protein [Tanacetum cinerariifolium]